MTGMLVTIIILCTVLVGWCTALTFLVRGQQSVLEAMQKALNEESVRNNKIDKNYEKLLQDMEDFKAEIRNEKLQAVEQAKHAREVMQAYRISTRQTAMRQEIQANDDGSKEIVAVESEKPEGFKWVEKEEDPEEPRS